MCSYDSRDNTALHHGQNPEPLADVEDQEAKDFPFGNCGFEIHENHVSEAGFNRGKKGEATFGVSGDKHISRSQIKSVSEETQPISQSGWEKKRSQEQSEIPFSEQLQRG